MSGTDSDTRENRSSSNSSDDGKWHITSFPKNKIQVLLLEGISKMAVDEFVKEGFQVKCLPQLSEADLIKEIKGVHALGIRSKTNITKAVLDAADRLLCVGAFCIGTDQTDTAAAALHGVTVFNAPFANTRSVAEMCLSLLIALARQLGDRSMECHAGKWNKVSSKCYEVRGKTLGIIGYGHVGSQLSILAEALGMQVIYYDIVPVMPLGNAKPYDSLESVLKEADFVSVHVPGIPSTMNLISERELSMMKQGAYLVNASRGKVVDVEAAAAALRSGHLGGAAFDVFPTEPPPIKNAEFKSPLRGCPNTILTPHIGGSTEEAQAAIGKEVSQKMISLINTGSTLGAVNMPSVHLPHSAAAHRLLNIHKNVPGVLRDINNILCDYNVSSQMLLTNAEVGYLMVELDSEVSHEVRDKFAALKNSIKTRILF